MPTFQSSRSAHVVTLIAALIGGSWVTPAHAQTSNAALAESLFREGKRLSSEHKYADACPKFAESYRLDPGLGTLLNLSTCHEAEGKLASAWAEFSEAMARAKRDGDNERAQLAEERVRALEPKLAHVSIALAPGAAVSGLVIKFDNRELSSATLGLQIPVDPGKHQMEASAPGKQSYSQAFDPPAQATNLTLTVPVLQDALTAPPSAAAPLPPTAPIAAEPPPSPEQHRSHAGLIVSGVATGLFAVGAGVSGVLYSSKRSEFNTANQSADPSRTDKHDSAQTLGVVNLVCVGGAVVSAGLFVYFLASGGSHEAAPAQSAKLQLAPVVGRDGALLFLRGAL